MDYLYSLQAGHPGVLVGVIVTLWIDAGPAHIRESADTDQRVVARHRDGLSI